MHLKIKLYFLDIARDFWYSYGFVIGLHWWPVYLGEEWGVCMECVKSVWRELWGQAGRIKSSASVSEEQAGARDRT